MSPETIAQRFRVSHLADPEFAQLNWELRGMVNERIDALRSACDLHASVGAAVAEFGRRCGLPAGSARRIWDNIVKQGWRGAIDGRKCKASETVTSRRAFMDFWFELVAKHNRSTRSAWSDLVMLWKSNVEIPGYQDMGGHPPAGPDGYPDGWSYKNLIRHKPSRNELTLSRIGRKAHAAQTSTMWTTREGMQCGQIYQFDDVMHDLSVFFGKQLIRPLELGCIDVASTKRVLWGLCPQIRTESGRIGIKENYMTWLVVGLLTEIGFRDEGCSLVVEHGTAAIREPFEKALFDLSKGRITVARSGIQDKPALLGYWSGEGGGNPRMKATLESLHSYYHNRMGLLPGQAGSNSRLDQPEDHKAMQKYAATLVRELDNCPVAVVDELLSRLMLPALTFETFSRALYDFYQVVDSRHEHNLEGWEKQGWIKTRWRLSENSGWNDEEDLAGLDPQQLQLWHAVVKSKPNLLRPVRLSPNEVWARRDNLRRLPQHAVPGLLGPGMGKEITVRDGAIRYEDQEIDPDGVRFAAFAEDVTGHQVLLKDRERYLTFLNPFRPERLLVCDGSGRYLGAAPRIQRAVRVDRNQVMAAMGQAAHRETALMAGFRARHDGDAVAHQEMIEHNALVFQGAKVLRPARTVSGKAELGDIFGPRETPKKQEVATEEAVEASGEGIDQLYGKQGAENE